MALLYDEGPTMTDDEFRLIRDLVEAYCGIHFGSEAKYVVERRLRERVRELALSDFDQYYRRLRFHPDAATELERAVEQLTTNETYFFRETYQLEAFEREILPALRTRLADRRRLTIWSAGCSTGEEVYTLAMILSQADGMRDWEIRIFGTDISRRCLQHARKAVYGPASFRVAPAHALRHFVETSRGRAVRPEIRAMCHFGHLNLLDRNHSAIVGNVDVVFCRNVLIYFDARARADVVRTFYERLVPGGYLLLGHSESLLHTSTDFELVHLQRDMVYRRPQFDPALEGHA